MKRHLLLFVVGLWNAADLSTAMMHICESNEQEFCSHLEGAGVPEVVKCLRGHLDELSKDCRELLELRRTTEEACAHDVHPLSCDEYKPVYPSPLACIMRKEEMASKGCHIAIKHMMEKLGTGIVRHYVHPGHLDL